jgi:hypothetical protein
MTTIVTAWLVTYWLHALAVALAGAVGIARLADPSLRERLWRVALVLPLLTATAAIGLRSAPEAPAGALVSVPTVASTTPPTVAADTGAWAERTPSAIPSVSPARASWWSQLLAALSSSAASRGLAFVWLAVGSVLALGLARDLYRWRRGLRARRPVLGQARNSRGHRSQHTPRGTDHRTCSRVAATTPFAAIQGERVAASDVRHLANRPYSLSLLSGLATPVVVGRDEVCLPERALTELGRDELAAVLAHEEAHIIRRDPAWMLGVALLVRLAWAQPFVALVARRWRADVERVCDLAAARRVGALPLVRGLERVATWTEGARHRSVFAPAATTTRSALVARVEGVLAPSASAPRRTVVAAGIGVAVGPYPGEAPEAEGAQPNEGAAAVMLRSLDSGEDRSPGPRRVVAIDAARARYSVGDARDLDLAALRTALRELRAQEPEAQIWFEPDGDVPISVYNGAVWAGMDAPFASLNGDFDRVGTDLPAPLRESVLTQALRHGARGIFDVQVTGDGRIDLWLVAGTAWGLGGGFVQMNERWLLEFVGSHDAWLTEQRGSSAGTELVWHLADEADGSCVVRVLELGHLAAVGARRVGFVAGSTDEQPLWCAPPARGAATVRITADGDDKAAVSALRANDRTLTLRVGKGVTVGRVAKVMRAARARGIESIAVVEDLP